MAYLGRRGRLTLFLRGLAQLDLEERRVAGALGNQAKGRLEELLDDLCGRVQAAGNRGASGQGDVKTVLGSRSGQLGFVDRL